MTFSVVICTWNRSSSLALTLDQLVALRIPAGHEWELIVVNNNCTDDTDTVCLGYASRLPIRVLHETTPGLSFARNHAVREARGQYIVWTDDDVLIDQEWLQALLAAFKEYSADWVFGASKPEWPAGTPAWYSPKLQGNFAVLDYGPVPFVVSDHQHSFFGLNFAGTREAHRDLGSFRTDYGYIGNVGAVGEDVDMFRRALARGMKIVYTPHARVRHVIPQTRATKAFQRSFAWRTNEKYYRHLPEEFPGVSWFLGVPRFLFGSALSNATGYLRSTLTFRRGEQFYFELQLIRFARLLYEGAKNGFGVPIPPGSIEGASSAGETKL